MNPAILFLLIREGRRRQGADGRGVPGLGWRGCAATLAGSLLAGLAAYAASGFLMWLVWK